MAGVHSNKTVNRVSLCDTTSPPKIGISQSPCASSRSPSNSQLRPGKPSTDQQLASSSRCYLQRTHLASISGEEMAYWITWTGGSLQSSAAGSRHADEVPEPRSRHASPERTPRARQNRSSRMHARFRGSLCKDAKGDDGRVDAPHQ